METWAWLGVYLLGFVILQVYLYIYFIKGASSSESSAERPSPSPPEGSSTSVEPPADVDESELITCPACGTYNRNEQMFAYCKACGERLA